MTQASKLPWWFDDDKNRIHANDKRATVVCYVGADDSALIVEAVNSHAALVERVAKLEAALKTLFAADAERDDAIIHSDGPDVFERANEKFWDAFEALGQVYTKP